MTAPALASPSHEPHRSRPVYSPVHALVPRAADAGRVPRGAGAGLDARRARDRARHRVARRSIGRASWRSQLAAAEVRERAQALAGAMARARSEAIKRGTRVDLCPSARTAASARAPANGSGAGSCSRTTPGGAAGRVVDCAGSRPARATASRSAATARGEIRLLYAARSRATPRRRIADGHVYRLPARRRRVQGSARQQRTHAHRRHQRGCP